MSLDYEIFDLGDFTLQRGATLRGAQLAYKTFGELNAKKDNAIVYPTWYSGQHYDNEWLVGEGMALDPKKYFIIIPNMLGNGLSSSPSNTPEPYNAARFPQVTAYDNVRAQHQLVTGHFGIEQLPLVTGWSMGGLQTFHWGAMFPDMVVRIAPFCGSAKCSRHNFVFLEGVKAALTADAAWNNGWYREKPEKGLRAAARVYAHHAVDLAERRHQRQRALRRRLQEGARGDHGEGLCHARTYRPLFSAGRQRIRSGQHGQCGTGAL
jgi:homoserine O-acetyltransferase